VILDEGLAIVIGRATYLASSPAMMAERLCLNRAAISLSGPRAGDALGALGVKTPEPRKAGLARIRDSATNEIIDEGLALWFPGPSACREVRTCAARN
jgi:tRNA U34 5-carboxymethylaminomethyl modifying GTPase MnmE/TrmE